MKPGNHRNEGREGGEGERVREEEREGGGREGRRGEGGWSE